MVIENRNRKLREALERNHMLEHEKVEDILEKINLQQQRIEKKQEILEKEFMFKHEKNNIKRKNKIKVLGRLSKIQEYQNEVNKYKIEEKMKRAEEFKEQKLYFLQKKKQMADKIAKQKNEVLSKFDKMMKKNGTISVFNTL